MAWMVDAFRAIATWRLQEGRGSGAPPEGEVIVSRLEKFHLGCRKQKTLVGVCRRLEPARGLGCFSALIKQTTEER